MTKLLAEQHLEFLSISGGCTGLSESTHVKMSHCLKSHAAAYLLLNFSSLFLLLQDDENKSSWLAKIIAEHMDCGQHVSDVTVNAIKQTTLVVCDASKGSLYKT